MLLVHHTYATKANITAQNHFIQTTNVMITTQLFGLFMLNHCFMLLFHRNKAKEVTMAIKCNTPAVFSCVPKTTLFYPNSCKKLLIIFGKNHYNSILNVLPQLQDPILITGWTDTDMHTF